LQSTGDSLDEEEEEKPLTEAKRNTAYNEVIDDDNPQTPSEVKILRGSLKNSIKVGSCIDQSTYSSMYIEYKDVKQRLFVADHFICICSKVICIFYIIMN